MNDQEDFRLKGSRFTTSILHDRSLQLLSNAATSAQAAIATSANVANLAAALIETFQGGGKLLVFGNGGSAADAQHLAAEFVNRFKIERPPLAAVALTTDTSVLTSVGNDYTFDDVFAKQVEALGKPGDLALGISTSGNSPNVLRGLVAARRKGLRTAALLGRAGGQARELVDLPIVVALDETSRIQEVHLMIEHTLCELIDEALFAPEPQTQ